MAESHRYSVISLKHRKPLCRRESPVAHVICETSARRFLSAFQNGARSTYLLKRMVISDGGDMRTIMHDGAKRSNQQGTPHRDTDKRAGKRHSIDQLERTTKRAPAICEIPHSANSVFRKLSQRYVTHPADILITQPPWLPLIFLSRPLTTPHNSHH